MIWQFVKSWLLRHAVTILSWLAAASAVIGLLFGTRQTGRNAERMEQLKKTLEIKNDQLRAAADSPRTRADLVKRLRDGKF